MAFASRYSKVSKKTPFDARSPFETIPSPPLSGGDTDGGDVTGGPAGVPGITGFDPGIASFGLGALSSVAPGIPGLVGTAVSQGLNNAGIFGIPSSLSTHGVQGVPDDTPVSANNVPTNLSSFLGQMFGISPATSFSVSPDAISPNAGQHDVDTFDITESANAAPSPAGWTDTFGLTSNNDAAPAGAIGPTGQGNVASEAGFGLGGSGSAGDGAAPSGGPGDGGAGEAPHMGGYIAGPGNSFASAGGSSLFDSLLALRQVLAANTPRRRSQRDLLENANEIGLAGGGTVTPGNQQQAFSFSPPEGLSFTPVQSIGGDPTAGDPTGTATSAPTGDAGDAGPSDAGTGDAPSDAGPSGTGAFHSGGYVGEQGRFGGDVMARLQPGEFVVPKGPYAEMLRQQNPALTKYGDLLTKSPIRNYMNPQQVAFNPIDTLIKTLGPVVIDGIRNGIQSRDPNQDPKQEPSQPQADPNTGNTNAPPAERQEAEPPAVREERGMQKIKKMMFEFQ